MLLQVLYNGMAEDELPQYDEKADVFSVGALVFEALTGYQPFLADSIPELLQLHTAKLGAEQRGPDGIPAFLREHGLSPLAQSFLAAMLVLDPRARTSAHELLQHAWCQAHMDQYQSRRSQSRMRRSLSEDAKAHMGAMAAHPGGYRMATAAL